MTVSARLARVGVLLTLAIGCADAGRAGPPPSHSQEPVPAPTTSSDAPGVPANVLERLRALALESPRAPLPDATNAFADDPAAAALGHKLFFDPRFAGPLLDSDNNGLTGTLGSKGETGKVACKGCHVPSAGFLDSRSSLKQISLAAGWTRRRAPSLLDFGQRSLLMWDGRRDAAYNQIFGVIESPLEFNSSRLFVAQQIARYYKAEYEALFGDLPSLEAYQPLEAAAAGCETLPKEPLVEHCHKPGHEDPAVLRIVVNAGKAIGAYMRKLSCGVSRFDAWVHGEADALSAEEQAGALLFVRSGCDGCHSGPNLTDESFHNLGVASLSRSFIKPYDDPGAAQGVQALLADELNSKGPYSDGYDGRLDKLPADMESLRGTFRTPSLRCVGMRPTFMHSGQLRSLEDVVRFFNRGGDTQGFQGVKDPRIVPLGLTEEESAALVAFLRALDGPGPAAELIAEPELP